MTIDMKGYKVIYRDHEYTCLSMESHTIKTHFEGGCTFSDAQKLRIFVLDIYGQLTVLDDVSWKFKFLKDVITANGGV